MKVLFKRGSTVENDNYVGPLGSLSLDTERLELRLHDGVTPGGKQQMSLDSLSDSSVLQTVFEGGTSIQTSDSLNAFSFSLKGHVGGDSHLALGTDDDNSRFSLLCASVTGDAPRLQLVGPQDVQTSIRGFALFDFGSTEFDLPDAVFMVRYANTVGNRTALTVNSNASLRVGNPVGGNLDDGTVNAQGVFANGEDVTTLPSFTVNTVPDATINEAKPVYVSDLTGGPAPCYSDGVNWRRFSDNTLID